MIKHHKAACLAGTALVTVARLVASVAETLNRKDVEYYGR